MFSPFSPSVAETIVHLQQLLIQDQSLRSMMQPLRLETDEILFRRGDPGDSLYLVERGRLRIYTLDPKGQEITLSHVESGECVGELALIDALPRSASVVAIGPAELLRLSREDFLQQVHNSPELTQCIINLLTARVRYMTEYTERWGQWARLIANEDYAEMSDSLAEMDSRSDPVLAAVADSVRLMVKAIQARERRWQEALAQLRIEIDQERRKQQVQEITRTDYFQSLLQQSRQRREARLKNRG